jgi:hypothetical protein
MISSLMTPINETKQHFGQFTAGELSHRAGGRRSLPSNNYLAAKFESEEAAADAFHPPIFFSAPLCSI